jgi:hypothetical protein
MRPPKGVELAVTLALRLNSTGAAYTPVSLGPDGKIYAQNDGVLFVLGQEDR